ncbi:BrnA antitoxin family protein [Paraburkholderia sp. BL10I2N1]|uniref:BrnA antitoxin family protein n=1 Tax=Paraburkholderia sp. BL10I2N1 TaxID=1938796 RepID=UPI0010622C9F|nr:BrnA antitoxin family protein [Paraburkholderia sp. BL10I2N1]TDN63226.1 uncharacterized protein (DUF4415 family) [Paraburkholderia sp. BL10I2N1]
MNANKRATRTEWVDPDDAPELTDEFFERADEYAGEKLVRRGRPAGSHKTATTIRFDDDILEAFRATGPRWQSRLNAAVRDWLKTHSPDEVTT